MKLIKAETASYPGLPGSYSHEAAKTLFPLANLQSCGTLEEAIRSVNEGAADVAVVPVENSIAGRVGEVHSLMLSLDLLIGAEHLLKIEHCLISNSRPDGKAR